MRLLYPHCAEQNKCVLCHMNLDKEKVRYEDKNFIVVDTLDKKGHNERIMIVRKEHGKTITPFTEW